MMRHGEIARNTTETASVIINVPAAFVFNMDEMGAERYADRKRINVFITRKKPG